VTEAVLGLLVVVLWLLWDIRRTLGLRARPGLPGLPARPTTHRPDFRGAVPPSRFVVIRWPRGLIHYNGCVGALARKEYEHQHPAPGEEVEFWELGDRRGHKEG
jgi:hypothetical protein